ncbi:MAG: DUF2442 domain-containing protein [Sedimentisphaerales bacterium]|nr:DUF2442 domain-containing protein [Sedimentisphaerales bacterium]
MGILAPSRDERVKSVRSDSDTLSVDLMDGPTITVPLAWYPRRLNATQEQGDRWEPSGGGCRIHRPDINESLSTEELLRGSPALQEPVHRNDVIGCVWASHVPEDTRHAQVN